MRQSQARLVLPRQRDSQKWSWYSFFWSISLCILHERLPGALLHSGTSVNKVLLVRIEEGNVWQGPDGDMVNSAGRWSSSCTLNLHLPLEGGFCWKLQDYSGVKEAKAAPGMLKQFGAKPKSEYRQLVRTCLTEGTPASAHTALTHLTMSGTFQWKVPEKGLFWGQLNLSHRI